MPQPTLAGGQMAHKKSAAPKGKKSAGKAVAVNPWLPAVPLKGRKLLKPVLAVPLAMMAGAASADLLPARALTVPAEAARQSLSAKDYERLVGAKKAEILRKFEGRQAFQLAQGSDSRGGGKSGQRPSGS